jgi:type IV pilus assembly protein PilA
VYCSLCGTHNSDGSQFCVSCGQSLPAVPPPAQSSQPTSPMTGEPQTSGKAIASLVCGFFSIIFPAAIAAIILGHVSRSEIRKSQGRLQGSGIALAGLIFGYMGVAFIPLLIIAAIAIPNLLRARISANESSAVSSVRTINTAQVTYRNTYPNVGYACDLKMLGGKGGSEQSAGFIDEKLASGEKAGYRFHIEQCSADGYAIVAEPETHNTTGVRYFCSKEDAVLKTSKTSPEDCLEDGENL